MAGDARHLRRHHLDHAASELDEASWDRLLRMGLVVVVISATVWALCSGLRWIIHHAADWLLHGAADASHPEGAWWLIGALTVGGLIQGFLLRRPSWRDAEGDGVNVALELYHSTYDHLPDDPQPRYRRSAFALMLRKAGLTTVTLSTSASGGLEGPVVLMGECAGAGWSRVFRVQSEFELRTYQLAGIAAAVGTLLGAPFTAALFATEIAFADRIIYRKLVYALLAGVVVYGLNNHLIGARPLFVAPSRPGVYALGEYLEVAAVTVAVSVPVTTGVAWVFKWANGVVDRVHPLLRSPLAMAGSGGLALAAWWALDLPPHHLLGMGEHTLAELLEGGSPLLEHWWVLALAVLGRMVTTSLTLQSGGSAGMLIPAMFMGGVSGAATHQALMDLGLAVGGDPAIFVVAGIAASLVAVIGVPLAAITLVLEVFGSAYGPAAVLSCGLAFVVTRRFRLYEQA